MRRWTSIDLARDIRGAEIAETAMVLPLVFMMLMAIFWFGQAFRIYGAITHAAREGARAAVAPACTMCAATAPATNAQTAFHNALAAAHLDKNNLVPWSGSKWTPPTLCPCGSASSSCVSASKSCDGSIADICVQINVQLSYSSQGGAGACGTSVSARYRYPYAFKIPLTTLDLNNMLLPAQAQTRVETQ